MIYDIIAFVNLCFRPSTRKWEAGVFKNLHSWNRFDNIVFNARKGRLPIRVDGRNEEKSLRFQKYLDMCKQGLNQLSKNKEQY